MPREKNGHRVFSKKYLAGSKYYKPKYFWNLKKRGLR